MKSAKLFALAATLVLISASAIAATPPGFDAQKWAHLQEKIATTGTPLQLGDGTEARYLANLVPDDTQVTHQAEYATAMGDHDGGDYRIFSIYLISETWIKADDGNWHIEQFSREVTPAGDLIGLDHSTLVEKPNGEVLDARLLPVGTVQDPIELARVGERMEFWFRTAGTADRIRLRKH